MDSIKFQDDSYIFIDFSNIYIGFYNHIINNYKKYRICNPRMDYNILLSIIEKDKEFKKKVLVGSKSLKNTKKNKNEEKEKKIFDNLGYEIYMLERINNKEQGVDDLLHEKLIKTISYKESGHIIIGSGDGQNGNYTDNSFYNICIEALEKGWYVTIVSWKKQLSKKYIFGYELHNLLNDVDMKNKFNILYLDNYVDILIN